jgi:hypothetical protein
MKKKKYKKKRMKTTNDTKTLGSEIRHNYHKQTNFSKTKKTKSQEKYTAKKKNYHREKNSLSPIMDEDYY